MEDTLKNPCTKSLRFFEYFIIEKHILTDFFFLIGTTFSIPCIILENLNITKWFGNIKVECQLQKFF